jgi:DNA ligase (NAD+)
LTKEDLLTLEGFADKKAENLISSIENSRSRSLARFITALGIRGVGEVGATNLARRFMDLDELSNADIYSLQSLEGIGPNIAQGILDWFSRPTNQEVIDKFKKYEVWPRSDGMVEREGIDQSFEGLTFVITGTLPAFTRDEAKEFIESRGGKVTDSVSKKTSYLVLGGQPGSKFAKAQSMGIPVLDEEALRQLAG